MTIASNTDNSVQALASFPPQPRQNVSASIQMEGLQNAMRPGRTRSPVLGGSNPGNSESEAEAETVPFIQSNHVS